MDTGISMKKNNVVEYNDYKYKGEKNNGQMLLFLKQHGIYILRPFLMAR